MLLSVHAFGLGAIEYNQTSLWNEAQNNNSELSHESIKQESCGKEDERRKILITGRSMSLLISLLHSDVVPESIS